MWKSYSELMKLKTFEERIEYLYLGDKLCEETFGNYRYLNQKLYTSTEWIRTRTRVIIRDYGCDLGIEGCDLQKRNIIIHHINPITIDDVINRSPKLFDMDNLISTSMRTHNYIHFGAKHDEPRFIERTPNDTCPWRM